MFRFLSSKKNNNDSKEFTFKISYGFPLGLEKTNYKNPELVPKSICQENKTEIYKIGNLSGEGWPVGNIYVLVWAEKVIPFLVQPPQIISYKNLSAYRKRFNKDELIAQYQIPLVSAVVMNIGENLKLLPRGRDYHSFYQRSVFLNQENHSYEFSSHTEYKDAINLIQQGLPILFYDMYDQTSYTPTILSEIIFDIGPWNFETDIYQQKWNNRHSKYNSEFRRAKYIEARLDRAYNLNILKKATKSSFEKQIYQKAQDIALAWMADLNENVNTPEGFMEFIEKHPEPTPLGNSVIIGDLFILEEAQNLLLQKIIELNCPALRKFEQHIKNLESEVCSVPNYPFEKIKNTPPKKDSLEEYFTHLIKNMPENLSIEQIMQELIEHETPYHYTEEWRHGSTFNINSLKNPDFFAIIKHLHDKKYKTLFADYEQVLITIAEIMVKRVSLRTAKETNETVSK